MQQLKQKEPLPSIEYIYSKLTYFPEGQQFTKNVFFLIGLMKYSNLLRYPHINCLSKVIYLYTLPSGSKTNSSVVSIQAMREKHRLIYNWLSAAKQLAIPLNRSSTTLFFFFTLYSFGIAIQG